MNLIDFNLSYWNVKYILRLVFNLDYLSIYVPKQGFGHSTFEMALDCKNQIEAKQIVFFHYDPGYSDEKLDLLSEEYSDENAIMSYEGLEISLLW